MSLIKRLGNALSASAPSVELLAADWPEDAGIEDGLITPAAVLVPIVDRPEPGVILTVRTDTMRRHAGQIAFPGGRIDPEDEDAIAAALREAEEEIGLPRDKVQVIGTADRYRTTTGFDVTPVLGIVPAGLEFNLQPDEVAAVFEAPLHYLFEPAHQHRRTVDWEGRERSYYEILWEGRRIWGATAAMIVNLSRRLAPAL
jgi:8-oxo-dGTP pyrophosphatase MutT (NUDIX family)